MKVLSLFDGISCARVALDRLGYKDITYYASETDRYALDVSRKNYPDIIQLGDVRIINTPMLITKDIDLLIGGSPCQDLSIAKKNRKGLGGERSGLFWEYVRILKEVQPKYFVLENVNSMPKEAKQIITETLGVEPIMINAALVSAQQRKRLFWTNIPNVVLPDDKGIYLKDIIHETRGEDFDLNKYIIKGNHLEWIMDKTRLAKKYSQINGDKSITMMARQYANWNGQYVSVRIGQIGKGGQGDRIYSIDGKSVVLSANGGGRGAKTGLYLIVPEATKQGYAIAEVGDSVDLSFPNSKTRRGRVGKKAKNIMTSPNAGVVGEGYVRKLTPIECCRLQSIPDNTCVGVSDSQAYKCLGNAFNAEVIKHILSNMIIN